jgi:hypothetical protein
MERECVWITLALTEDAGAVTEEEEAGRCVLEGLGKGDRGGEAH